MLFMSKTKKLPEPELFLRDGCELCEGCNTYTQELDKVLDEMRTFMIESESESGLLKRDTSIKICLIISSAALLTSLISVAIRL